MGITEWPIQELKVDTNQCLRILTATRVERIAFPYKSTVKTFLTWFPWLVKIWLMGLWNVLKISINLKDTIMHITCSSKIISSKLSSETSRTNIMPQSNNWKKDARPNKKRVSTCKFLWENLKVSYSSVREILKFNSKLSNSNYLEGTSKN